MAHGPLTTGWRRYTSFFIVTVAAVCISDTRGFTVPHEENRMSQDAVSVGAPGGSVSPEVTYVLHQMLQVLQERDQHTALYERIAVLEGKITDKSQEEIRFKTEFAELKAKIPVLEEQIANLTIMKQKSDMFEIKMEKLIHKYEEKLSTLASEIIRLKKNEARFRDLQALRDQTGNSVLLRKEIEECPSMGIDLDAVRVGEDCLYMAWRSSLNWSASHDHCQALGGDLATPQDLLPLKTLLHSTFARGPSLWLGATYDEFTSSSSTQQRLTPPYQQDQRPDPRTAALMLHQLKEEDQEVRVQGAADHALQGHDMRHLHSMTHTLRNDEMQSDEGRQINHDDGTMSNRGPGLESKTRIYSIQDISMDAPSQVMDTNTSLEGKMKTGDGVVEIESSISSGRHIVDLQDLHTEHLSDSITPMLIQRPLPDPESEGNPSKIRCLLLWLNQALEYELVGRPCNERHYFVCQIHKERKQEMPFEMASLLQE